jgi:hypothetical protein
VEGSANERRDRPGLNPVREKLAVDGRLEDGALALEEREQPGRVAHAVNVDQVLVPPGLAERDRVGEPMVLAHAVAAAGVLRAADRLGKGDVHHVVVERVHWQLSLDVVSDARGAEDDRLLRISLVRHHADEAAAAERGAS